MGPFCFKALLAVLASCCCCEALRFYIHDRERRCFQFEAPYGARVLGHRSIANGKGGQAQLSLEIKSTTGKRVYESHSGDPKDAMFSFITPAYDSSHEDYDEYDYETDDQMASFSACVTLTFDETMHTEHGKRAVTFWVQVDHRAAQSSSGHATASGVTRMTESLSQMQQILKALLKDLAALQMRERRLVKRTQLMARSLRNFAALSMIVLVGVSYFQLLYYKKFFTAKKLM